MVNTTFGSWKKSCFPKIALSKLSRISCGLLKKCVSEICVNVICVNQGVGVLLQKSFKSNVDNKKLPDDGDKSEECFVGQQISYL